MSMGSREHLICFHNLQRRKKTSFCDGQVELIIQDSTEFRAVKIKHVASPSPWIIHKAYCRALQSNKTADEVEMSGSTRLKPWKH